MSESTASLDPIDATIPMVDEREDDSDNGTNEDKGETERPQALSSARDEEEEAVSTTSKDKRGSLNSFQTLQSEDLCSEEQDEKARLIAQVLELQNTLEDLSSRVDNVKEENLRLRSENQVLGQYIENLMAASSVFQPTTSGAMTAHNNGKVANNKN